MAPANSPRHVAIIMDGNGRWAEQRGYPRFRGHLRGIRAVRRIVDGAARLGIECLTLYAFSSENWSRPPAEVGFLMRLLTRYLRREKQRLQRKGVRLLAIGDLARLPAAAQSLLEECRRDTAGNRRLTLCLALSYGGRQDIVSAARALAGEAAAGRLDPENIDEEMFAGRLATAGLPDPDLLIRTAGEKRQSNFLLWQCSYAEWWTTPLCWPDFRVEQLEEALAEFGRRRRKFGGLAP